MKLRLLAATAVLATAAIAAPASADITVVNPLVANDLFGTTLAAHGQVMLDDFDAINNVNTTYSGFTRTYQAPVSDSAAPPYTGPGSVNICCAGAVNYNADSTTYASVQGGSTATYSVINGFALSSFSFYMGSPDAYNRVTFNLVGGGTKVLDGNPIWGGLPADPQGDRTLGYRVYYDFGGAKVSSIDFYSRDNAFEFDGLAGSLTAVPEPASWALMIAGFGGVGAALRSRRRQALVAA
jgi:hypothetical protein